MLAARSPFFLKALRPVQFAPVARLMMSSSSTSGDADLPYVTDKGNLKPSTLPNVPKQGSYKIDMEQGKTYYWCTCGNSKAQPWCDGSHAGTEFRPFKFTWEEESRRQSICGCKMNRDDRGAKCDRSHRLVDFDNLD